MNWQKELYGNGLYDEVDPILVKMRDNFSFVDFTKVSFTYLRDNTTRRMGRISYHHHDGTAEIALHPGLDGADLRESITHELAHFVSWRWKGEFHHGYHWGFVMILFGYDNPQRLAPEEVAQRALRRR